MWYRDKKAERINGMKALFLQHKLKINMASSEAAAQK